jgi:hypothetical protein
LSMGKTLAYAILPSLPTTKTALLADTSKGSRPYLL